MYCCDTIEDRNDDEVLSVTEQSLGNAVKDPQLFDGEVLRSGKSSPAKPSVTMQPEPVPLKRQKTKHLDKESVSGN